MNFFENELRKIFADSGVLDDPSFVGRSCFVNIGKDLRARIEFCTNGCADHYSGLQATILNRTDGVVDKMMFALEDILGIKPVPNNPNFRNGVSPHIWTYGGKSEWYAFEPTYLDYQKICESVSNYIDVFRTREDRQKAASDSQIEFMEELSDVVTAVANRAIEVATENTSTGAWVVKYDDVSDLISKEDFHKYFDLIASEVQSHFEILDLELTKDYGLDINCGLAWCKGYAPIMYDEYQLFGADYGGSELIPLPSLTHLARVGQKVMEHIIKEGSLDREGLEDMGVTAQDMRYFDYHMKSQDHAYDGIPREPTTWIAVYKDTLGHGDDFDNVTSICVPTDWLLNILKEEGEDPKEWFNDYTADSTDGIARTALAEGVILDCEDEKIKADILAKAPSLDKQIEAAASRTSASHNHSEAKDKEKGLDM